MAFGYLEPQAGSAHPPRTAAEVRRIGHVVNLAGAVLSVALIVGVGWWSYRLMVRDVSGVPVIRALDGPMRVSPADPGGRQAAYQGLSVNAVAAQDGAPGQPRQILLAPQPTGVAPEDRQAIGAGVVGAELAPIVAPSGAPPAAAVESALALALGQDIGGDGTQGATGADATGALPLGTPGLARSPLPQRRPARLGTSLAAVSAPGADPGTGLGSALGTGSGDRLAEAALNDIATRLSGSPVDDIDPTSLTAGTRLVQLGAFETDAEARQAWAQLVSRFPGYLDGRGRVVEAATAGGRVFFRLRAHGFRDELEARRFCSVFVAEDVDCIPVLIR
jgi:hypothetical protein